jgi:hypothetical protein
MRVQQRLLVLKQIKGVIGVLQVMGKGESEALELAVNIEAHFAN